MYLIIIFSCLIYCTYYKNDFTKSKKKMEIKVKPYVGTIF